jgi:hypothetical protein
MAGRLPLVRPPGRTSQANVEATTQHLDYSIFLIVVLHVALSS